MDAKPILLLAALGAGFLLLKSSGGKKTATSASDAALANLKPITAAKGPAVPAGIANLKTITPSNVGYPASEGGGPLFQ